MLLGWDTVRFLLYVWLVQTQTERLLVFISSSDDADRWILVYSSPLYGVRFVTTISDSLGLYLLHFAQ